MSLVDILSDQLFPSCCLATNQGGGRDAWGGGGTISGSTHNFVGIAFTTGTITDTTSLSTEI